MAWMRHADSITLSCLSSLALNWFKDHFIKCNDRAALVKTWLPVTYDGPKTWLDQLVYDRALVLVGLSIPSLFLRFKLTISLCRVEPQREKSCWIR